MASDIIISILVAIVLLLTDYILVAVYQAIMTSDDPGSISRPLLFRCFLDRFLNGGLMEIFSITLFFPPLELKDKSANNNYVGRAWRNRPTPPGDDDVKQADRILDFIKCELDHTERIDLAKKQSLLKQALAVRNGLVSFYWTRKRIKQLKTSISVKESLKELTQTDQQITLRIEYGHQSLENLVAAVLRLEIIGGPRNIDRLINDLTEATSRMNDTIDAHIEIRSL